MRYTETELYESGWKLWRKYPHWQVFYKKNSEAYHHYFSGYGLDFITLFPNGRAAKGCYQP